MEGLFSAPHTLPEANATGALRSHKAAVITRSCREPQEGVV